jgi:hypothetical protein
MRNIPLILLGFLAACSAAPRTVSERDMQGVFTAEGTRGGKALIVEFLPDGRFGGDLPEADGMVRTQGYWRMGVPDAKRACTIIETKPPQGQWREGFCASMENERTALNCAGDGDERSCLMTRKPRGKASDAMQIGGNIPVSVDKR